MTVHIELLTPVDRHGHSRYLTTWPADNIGPRCDQTGTRGQVSHGDPDAAVAQWQAKGHTVEVVR